MNLKPEKIYNGKLSEKRIDYLDTIRFVACFMVVFFHFIVALPQTQQYLSVWGRVGVGMFFMISGAALINNYYGNIHIKQFYKKRFFSIYIPFYIAYFFTFIYLVIRNSFHLPFEAPRWTFIFTILGIDGYASCLGAPSFYILGEWFLSVIIFIYLIFPLWRIVFIKFPTLTLVSVFILRILLIIGIIPSPVLLCFNVIPAISYFTLGAYLMLLTNKMRFTRVVNISLIVVSAILIVIGALFNHYLYKVDIGEVFSSLGLYITIAIISCFIKNKLLNKFIKYVSSISYEIFLLHHITILVICSAISSNFNKYTFIFGGIITAALILNLASLLNKSVKTIRGIKHKSFNSH